MIGDSDNQQQQLDIQKLRHYFGNSELIGFFLKGLVVVSLLARTMLFFGLGATQMRKHHLHNACSSHRDDAVVWLDHGLLPISTSQIIIWVCAKP